MQDTTKSRLKFLAGFAVYFGALWFLWDTVLVYPLKVFVVLLHEISHGVVAVATGGTIERIVLDPYQGGACYCPGGNGFLTLSAGYLGSLVWGGLLLTAGQSKRLRPDWITGTIGGLTVILTLLFVRSAFGIAFGIAFGAALLIGARKLSAAVNRGILLVLGLTSALYAILDIKSDVLDRPHLPSDAYMLSELTGVPTGVWGVLWIVLALLISGLLFQRAWERVSEG
jgi:hypothetical protein